MFPRPSLVLILIFLHRLISPAMERQTLLCFALPRANGLSSEVRTIPTWLSRLEPTETFRCRRILTVMGKQILQYFVRHQARGSSTARQTVRRPSLSSVPQEI